jgi:hypothetical protein
MAASVVGLGYNPNSAHCNPRLMLSIQPRFYLPIDMLVYGLQSIEIYRVAVGVSWGCTLNPQH